MGGWMEREGHLARSPAPTWARFAVLKSTVATIASYAVET